MNTETCEDPTVLPLPNHVMLNHLYSRDYDGNDEMKDVMILGTTARYRDKFITTVFYRPKPKLPETSEPEWEADSMPVVDRKEDTPGNGDKGQSKLTEELMRHGNGEDEDRGENGSRTREETQTLWW